MKYNIYKISKIGLKGTRLFRNGKLVVYLFLWVELLISLLFEYLVSNPYEKCSDEVCYG